MKQAVEQEGDEVRRNRYKINAIGVNGSYFSKKLTFNFLTKLLFEKNYRLTN